MQIEAQVSDAVRPARVAGLEGGPEYFDLLMREAARLLLTANQPYLAHRLMQLRNDALAGWPPPGNQPS